MRMFACAAVSYNLYVIVIEVVMLLRVLVNKTILLNAAFKCEFLYIIY